MTANLYTSGEYLKKNPTWHAQTSPWKAAQILKMLERRGLAPKTICEVGCGAGEILKHLRDRMDESARFVGYEISPQAFDLCRKHESARLHFECKNILDEKDVFFDLILLMDVVEHIEDCFTFLRAIRPKSQYKILHIPLDLSVQSVLRVAPLRKIREQLGHLHHFTKETALAVLRNMGYEIADYFYTTATLDLPAASWKSYLARLPRRVLFALHRDFAVRLLGGCSLLVLAK